MTVGSGSLRFEAVPGWPDVPDEAGLIEAVGVAVDSQDQVYVFARADLPVLVFSTDGDFIRGWGRDQFVRPHGIWIAEDDSVYLVDDMGHSVRRFSPNGELLQTIGPSGTPSDTGAGGEGGFDHRTIRSGSPPYNLPTNLVAGPDGDLFITDGYGNARVHRFSVDGQLIASWGEPGDKPGEFNVPHGIGSDGERLYVCDRENSRVQIFSPDGELLAIWSDVARPAEVFIDREGLAYVFELGFRTGVFPWQKPNHSKSGGRMTVFDRDGNVLTRWGGGSDPSSPEDFYAPHDVYLDSRGSVYTAEVKTAAARLVGEDTTALPSLRKFVRC